MKLGILIPVHSPWVTIEWALNQRKFRVPKGTEWFVHRSPMPIDKARTWLVKEALRHRCTHVFFIDADIILPPDAFTMMYSLRFPVISAMYPDKGGRGCAFKDGKPLWVEKGAMEVDEVGLGCCLIDTKVFQRVQEPWFVYEYEEGGSKPSEDVYFCRKIREFGFSVLVTGDVKARHVFTGAMVDPARIEHLVL